MYQPNDQILAAATNRRPAPVCQSEGFGNADLADIATGLRAMVKGNLPQAKPAAPVVIGEVLPQSGPRDYVARRAKQIKGKRFCNLAQCEEIAWAEIRVGQSNTRAWAERKRIQHKEAQSNIEAITALVNRDKEGPDTVNPEELGWWGTTEGTVLDQLASDEEAAWKVEAIKAALSDREWTAIQMKAEGLPDAAIAEAIGASLPTAKKVVRKARAKAKAALA